MRIALFLLVSYLISDVQYVDLYYKKQYTVCTIYIYVFFTLFVTFFSLVLSCGDL